MLEAPRELLAFALLPLNPPDPPLMAPGLPPPPPLPRLAELALGLAPPPRLALLAPGLAPPPAPRLAVLALGLAPRAPCEPPLVDPPYLFAEALLEYGAPPRCAELCDQLFPPLPLRLMFVFLLKLLLTLMLTLLVEPQPQWQHDPPQAAPIMTPAVNVMNMAPGGGGGG